MAARTHVLVSATVVLVYHITLLVGSAVGSEWNLCVAAALSLFFFLVKLVGLWKYSVFIDNDDSNDTELGASMSGLSSTTKRFMLVLCHIAAPLGFAGVCFFIAVWSQSVAPFIPALYLPFYSAPLAAAGRLISSIVAAVLFSALVVTLAVQSTARGPLQTEEESAAPWEVQLLRVSFMAAPLVGFVPAVLELLAFYEARDRAPVAALGVAPAAAATGGRQKLAPLSSCAARLPVARRSAAVSPPLHGDICCVSLRDDISATATPLELGVNVGGAGTLLPAAGVRLPQMIPLPVATSTQFSTPHRILAGSSKSQIHASVDDDVMFAASSQDQSFNINQLGVGSSVVSPAESAHSSRLQGRTGRLTGLGQAIFGQMWQSGTFPPQHSPQSISTSTKLPPIRSGTNPNSSGMFAGSPGDDSTPLIPFRGSSTAVKNITVVGLLRPTSATDTHLSSISTLGSTPASSSAALRSVQTNPLRGRQAHTPLPLGPSLRSVVLLFIGCRGYNDSEWYAQAGLEPLTKATASPATQSPRNSSSRRATLIDLVRSEDFTSKHESPFDALLAVVDDVVRVTSSTVLFCSEDTLCLQFGLRPSPKDPLDCALDAYDSIRAAVAPKWGAISRQGSRRDAVHVVAALVQSRVAAADVMALSSIASKAVAHFAPEKRTGDVLIDRCAALSASIGDSSGRLVMDHAASCATMDRCITRPVGVVAHSGQLMHELVKRVKESDAGPQSEWHLLVERREDAQVQCRDLFAAADYFEEGRLAAAIGVLQSCADCAARDGALADLSTIAKLFYGDLVALRPPR